MNQTITGHLTAEQFYKALDNLQGKLNEASLTTERVQLRDIFEELQHLAADAKNLVMNGGAWERSAATSPVSDKKTER